MAGGGFGTGSLRMWCMGGNISAMIPYLQEKVASSASKAFSSSGIWVLEDDHH
jgi:hypothetical protein